MVARVQTGSVVGLEGALVEVEVDLAQGLPAVTVVGLPDAAVQALHQMGLRGREHLPLQILSQGQKRRVALARLGLSPARLWLLDEPFVALDTAAQKVLTEVLNEHLNRQGMVLLTSHQAVSLAGQGQSYRLTA